jgi:pimeloyl-ACP methyl ester carboxylesterase
MGGGGTLTSASNRDAIQDFNIVAAMAHHPSFNGFLQAFEVGYPIIPTFVTTGTEDIVVNPDYVYEYFQDIPSENKILVNLKGAAHQEPTEDDCRYKEY